MEIFAVVIGAWVLCAVPIAVFYGRAARICARNDRSVSRSAAAPAEAGRSF